jgi:hypothetical protein
VGYTHITYKDKRQLWAAGGRPNDCGHAASPLARPHGMQLRQVVRVQTECALAPWGIPRSPPSRSEQHRLTGKHLHEHEQPSRAALP